MHHKIIIKSTTICVNFSYYFTIKSKGLLRAFLFENIFYISNKIFVKNLNELNSKYKSGKIFFKSEG